MVDNKKALAIIIILGAGGVLAWYLWKKEKEKEVVIEKEDFIISKLEYPPEASFGEQITITVFGKNLKEEGDCYCKIINNDTENTLFYEHDIVGEGELKAFVFTTIMPNNNLNLRIETGKIIAGAEERHSYQDIIIKLKPLEGVAAEITSLKMEID